ncbi:MAG: ester cyclase [Polyangiaceae bacterium]
MPKWVGSGNFGLTTTTERRTARGSDRVEELPIMNSNISRILSVTGFVLSACSADGTADDAAQADLSPAEQVAIIEQRIEATNTRDWDRWQALHTPDATRSAPEFSEPLRGSAAMREAIEGLSRAFPDYHLELVQAFGAGQWLAVRIHTKGTMTGPLMLSDGIEVPATGRSIEQDWTALVRFEGARIAQFDEFYDQYGLMLQLGLLGE